jgi:hypothetical protein
MLACVCVASLPTTQLPPPPSTRFVATPGPVGPLCVGNGTDLPYFKQNITVAGTAAEVWSATAPGSNSGGQDTFIMRYPGMYVP